MANGDTKTESYLRVAAEGTRADLPSDTCCNTKTQNLILGVANRIMDVEDEVEELKNNPDVADIVSTYADLQNYDTSKLTDKDIIRVLQDETHNDDSTYYRYDKSADTFTYIGESKQYTDFVGTDGQTAGVAGLVPAPATTDAGKFLKADGTWSTAGGGGGGSYTAGDGIDITNNTISVDTDTIQEKLTAGTGIDITGNTISATGGSGPTVVQTTGTSTTDVMSQNSTTSMVYADPSTKRYIQMGGNANVGNPTSSGGRIAIGYNATATGNNRNIAIGTASEASSPQHGSVAMLSTTKKDFSINIGGKPQNNYSGDGNVVIGFGAETQGSLLGTVTNSVALGRNALCARNGEVNIGSTDTNYGYNNTNYRVIGGVHDGQDAHDAVTVEQVNGVIDAINTALNTNISHIGAQS